MSPVYRQHSKYPRRDADPGELVLVRVAHHLWPDRKRALRASDLQDVNGVDAALKTVGELQRLVKQQTRKAA